MMSGVKLLPLAALLVLVAVVNADSSVTITPEFSDADRWGGYYFARLRSSLKLTCVTTPSNTTSQGTNPAAAAYSWTHTANPNDPPLAVVQPINPGGSLIKRSLTAQDAGNYSCTDGVTGATAWYFVNVLHDDALEPDIPSGALRTVVTRGTESEVRLHCEQRFHPKFPLRWTHPITGATIRNASARHHRTDSSYYTLASAENDYDLIIRSNVSNDATVQRYTSTLGDYGCELDTRSTGVRLPHPVRKFVGYVATPDVKIHGNPGACEASSGITLKITCAYAGGRTKDEWSVQWAVNRTLPSWSPGALNNGPQQQPGYRSLLAETDRFNPCPVAHDDPERQCLTRNPRYTFTHDTAVEAASGHLVQTSVLEIHNVTEKDAGEYSCVVINADGWNSATVNVRVTARICANPTDSAAGQECSKNALTGVETCICSAARRASYCTTTPAPPTTAEANSTLAPATTA